MATDKLYDLALRLKKTELWKQLSDTELFAIKLSAGKTGYCGVMGALGEHAALTLYVDRGGLDSYRSLYEAREARNTLVQHEIFMTQDCLQCSFENRDDLSPFELEETQSYAKNHEITWGQNGYPQFRRYLPGRYPWFLKDEKDEKYLSAALSAALEIAKRLKTTSKHSLGFTDGTPYNRTVPLLTKSKSGYRLDTAELPARQKKSYPSPLVGSEPLIARLKENKATDQVWACEAIMFPNPTRNEAPGNAEAAEAPVNAPYFPYTLVIVDLNSNSIIESELVADYDRDAGILVTALAHAMAEHGVPSEIQVQDKRTQALLSAFSGQIDMKITYCDTLPLLDVIEEDMLSHFSGSPSPDAEKAGDVYELLMQMDDETFMNMPAETQNQLLELDSRGALPEPVSSRLRQLTK